MYIPSAAAGRTAEGRIEEGRANAGVEGLGAPILPAILLASHLLKKAIRLNHCHSEWLGWTRDRRAIEQLLGFKKRRPAPDKFALAVAAWQDSKNLKKDGIIGWETLNKMRPLLGKVPLAKEPERPGWIRWLASPNHESRKGKAIDTLIYHATSGTQIRNTLNTFTAAGKTSAHFVIARDGQIIQMVPLDRAAQHAGQSFNRRSIGIEIVNIGPRLNRGKAMKMCDRQGRGNKIRQCLLWNETTPVLARSSYYRYKAGSWLSKNEYWVPYTEQQYRSLIRLTNFLVACIPTINRITGHEHLLSWKKKTNKKGKTFFTKPRNDPGGAFDWARIQRSLPPWFGGRVCHQHGKFIKASKKISPDWSKCFKR